MADISKLEQQADLLMQNVMGWETSTLERIGKRIKRYGKLSLADVKSINNIATVKQDMDAITKELAKVTGYVTPDETFPEVGGCGRYAKAPNLELMSRAIKDYCYSLIDAGKDSVEVTEFNADFQYFLKELYKNGKV